MNDICYGNDCYKRHQCNKGDVKTNDDGLCNQYIPEDVHLKMLTPNMVEDEEDIVDENAKEYTWSKKPDDERWQHEIFGSVEECIADALENYDFKKGDTIAIGICYKHIVEVDGEDILERIEEMAFDDVGEAAEDWINYKDKKSISDLSEKLTNIVNEWLKKTGQKPSFYRVVDIETVEI